MYAMKLKLRFSIKILNYISQKQVKKYNRSNQLEMLEALFHSDSIVP